MASPEIPSLTEGLLHQHGTVIESLKALFFSPFGKTPEAIQVATLKPLLSPSFKTKAEHVKAYIEVTGGSVSSYMQGSDMLLPPTYASTWSMRILCQLLTAAGLKLPMARVLHAGNKVEVHSWPVVGQELQIESRIISIDHSERRTILVGRMLHRDMAGQLLMTVDMTLFFPGQAKKKGSKSSAKKDVARIPFGVDAVHRFTPQLKAIRRYTAVSGDFNPVHISDLAAQLSGFPRAFIHGYASKAIAFHALFERTLKAQPERFKSLELRFVKPIYTGLDVGVYAHNEVKLDKGHALTIDIGPGPGEASLVTGTLELNESEDKQS